MRHCLLNILIVFFMKKQSFKWEMLNIIGFFDNSTFIAVGINPIQTGRLQFYNPLRITGEKHRERG